MPGFDEFAGNGPLVARLRSKIVNGRLPHAMIFSGADGIGKRTLALMIAKALNCERARSVDDFCGACPPCHRIDAGTHADLVLLRPGEDSREIKIAQVRELLHLLNFQPLEGRARVYIIDPADAMNAASANALLKGLEEPPEHTFFFLITANAHELLVTVRSRSQVYQFTPISDAEMRRHGVTDEVVLRLSGGSLGLARSSSLEEMEAVRQPMADFIETAICAKEQDFAEMMRAAADLGRAKQDFPERMAVAAVLARDLLQIKEGLADRIVNIDMRDRLERLAAMVTIDQVIRLADFLRFVESTEKQYLNKQMLADSLALTLNPVTAKILHDNTGSSR